MSAKSRDATDQLTVVIWAVGDQLHVDGRPLDPTKTMGSDFGYSSELMQGFLGGVHGRLAWHHPAYDFSFDVKFIDGAVSQTVGALTNSINGRTHLRKTS